MEMSLFCFGQLPKPFYDELLYQTSQWERNKEISVWLNLRLKLAILKKKKQISDKYNKDLWLKLQAAQMVFDDILSQGEKYSFYVKESSL